jgi:fucose permease
LIIGANLRQGDNWRGAYLTIGIIQGIISVVLVITLPLWNRASRLRAGLAGAAGREQNAAGTNAAPEGASTEAANTTAEGNSPEAATAPAAKKVNLLRIPGVVPALITFAIYCATEYTLGLWGASFLAEMRGFAKAAAATAVSLYYAGITLGRFFSGILTLRFTGVQLIRAGLCIITVGAVLLLLPLPGPFALAALMLIGFGCSPIYPSMIHLTPERFGAENSQKIIGVQMASAYTGATFIPPLVGLVLANTHMLVLPFIMAGYGVAMFFMSERINRKCRSAL